MPSRRSLTWSLAATTTMLSAACGWLSTSSPPPQPAKIVFQETSFDFGRAEQGTKVTHTFAFRNGGGLDLTIDNVRTACDCTAALTSARVVAPGGEAAIAASFDTADDFGRMTRTITVYTNDPAQPVTTLTITGAIHADVAADPSQLYVGHLRRGQTAPFEVRLVVADAALAIGSVETTGQTIDASVRDASVRDASLRTAPADKWVRVAVKSAAPVGRFTESVRVHTSSRQRPALTIPVTGIVDGDDAGKQQ